MKLTGHGQEPNQKDCNNFILKCNGFIQRKPGLLIGVHCTHGFNRTGYLITNYLVQSRGYKIHHALDEFSKSRPCGIYRQNYIDILWKLNGSTTQAPKAIQPHWLTQDDNSKEQHTKSQLSHHALKRKQRFVSNKLEKKIRKTSTNELKLNLVQYPSFFGQNTSFAGAISPITDHHLKNLILNDIQGMISSGQGHHDNRSEVFILVNISSQ